MGLRRRVSVEPARKILMLTVEVLNSGVRHKRPCIRHWW
jgi:hypothetical protein